MPQSVSDFRANPNENILHAARVIGRSKDRRKVYAAICHGKRAVKTVGEIAVATKLTRKRVLTQGRYLCDNQLVDQTRKDGDTAYRKDAALAQYTKRILSIVDKPSRAQKYPTKQEPRGTIATTKLQITLRTAKPRIVPVTVDHVDSFSKVKTIHGLDRSLNLKGWREESIKRGLRKVIGETREFKDWGGEKNDLYTNKLKLKGRKHAAFALKGRATKGVLTPKKMGKHGDQISRLVGSTAQVVFVVYHSAIDESVVAQLQAFAFGKALSGETIYYGIIDGDDLNRLVQAYRSDFRDK